MTLEDRIATAAEKLRSNHVSPQMVHLTKADAAQLQYEMINKGGEVARAIMLHGLNKALPKIHGLQIIWRSQSFQVV